MIDDIYSSPLLKYPLSKSEYNKIKDVWKFISIFKGDTMDTSVYRENLIKEMREKYKAKDFYDLETIATKLFWNLRWLLFPLWIYPDMTMEEYYVFVSTGYNKYNSIPYSLILANNTRFTDFNNM